MVTLEHHRLVFRFPEVDPDAVMAVNFQRTLRIPDDNRDYPLPPGLGSFPLAHVDDYRDRVPETWVEHGGVFLPMYQAEALWIWFSSLYPFAVKVAAGKINAVTGEGWCDELSEHPQDYLVVPDQPWLDGFCVAKGLIRQFVAMPLGEGYTAEEQLTGTAEHGGIQLLVHPMKAEAYRARQRTVWRYPACCYKVCYDMGLAPGGLMRQKIYEDEYGFASWDRSVRSRCFVHIANSLQYAAITGQAPPTEPPTAAEYTAAGLPWFEYYDADRKALAGAPKLAKLESVAAKTVKLGKGSLPGNEPVSPANVKRLSPHGAVVREGKM